MANKPKKDFLEELISSLERAGMRGMGGGMRAPKPSPRSKPSRPTGKIKSKKKKIVGTQTTMAIRKKTSKRRKKKY